MSISGGHQPNALGPPSSARPLLVPAADVLAKNMRAQENYGHSESMTSRSYPSSPFFMGLGSEPAARKFSERQTNARFQRATPSRPNPLLALISRMFSSNRNAAVKTSDNDENTPTVAVKMATSCEKAAALLSRAPDPTLIFLVEMLLVLLIQRIRPRLFDILGVQILSPLLLLLPLILAFFWRHTQLFKMIREKKSVLTHPAEHRLDGAEADLAAREQRLRAAQDTLKKDHSRLDELKKELVKTGDLYNSINIIIPNRKAAELIVAGALGPGYDAITAHEVEVRRRLENVQKCRQQWRQRVEEHDDNRLLTAESMKLLASHVSTAYSKKTKELKMQSNNGTGPSDILSQIKRVTDTANPIRGLEGIRRHTMQSDRSAGVSVDSRRRLTLFRRKRRDTAPVLGSSRNPQGTTRLSETGVHHEV